MWYHLEISTEGSDVCGVVFLLCNNRMWEGCSSAIVMLRNIDLFSRKMGFQKANSGTFLRYYKHYSVTTLTTKSKVLEISI